MRNNLELDLLKFWCAFPEIDSLDIYLPLYQIRTSKITVQQTRLTDITDRELFSYSSLRGSLFDFNKYRSTFYVFNLLGTIPKEVELIAMSMAKNNRVEKITKFFIANPTPRNIEKEILKLEEENNEK